MSPSSLSAPTRLEVLRRLSILDTPPEPAYDDIARLASVACQSPTAAVNFVDDTRHWTKAAVGAGQQGASVSAEVSFCAATVSTPGGLLTVSDTLEDPEWQDHPLVQRGPKVRFYAGASIVVSGETVGVVCVYGDEPRPFGEAEAEALQALARQASAHLELRERNAQLRELAVRDPLTGLANRTLLSDRLDMAIAERRRSGGDVGVLFCDVDDFKAVNDRSGHAAGDQLLCEIAAALRDATRETDTVARVAGDEFVVLCPGLVEATELAGIVDRIRRAIPDLSVGVATVEDGDSAAEVLQRADAAMYLEKSARAC